jgi:nicotinamidase-related amidase
LPFSSGTLEQHESLGDGKSMRALMIIDVQKGMFAIPKFRLHEGEATVKRIEALLRRARAGGVPIFFVQHAGGEGDPFAPGSPGFPFCEELTPAPKESVTVKRHCSAFRETDLGQTLKRNDIDELIICGMQTEYCVDTAVRAAVERGYRVTLVSDGHTTFDTQALPGEKIIAHHNTTLGDSFARLKRADEIVF